MKRNRVFCQEKLRKEVRKCEFTRNQVGGTENVEMGDDNRDA